MRNFFDMCCLWPRDETQVDRHDKSSFGMMQSSTAAWPSLENSGGNTGPREVWRGGVYAEKKRKKRNDGHV